MSKHSSRRHRHKGKGKSANRYRVIITCMSMAIAIGGSVAYLSWPRELQTGEKRQALAERVNVWWAEHKLRIATKMAKSQEKIPKITVASKAKSSAPEPLHFEFYNMLPDANASVAAVTTTESSTIFNHDNLEREFAKTVEKTSYIIQTGIYNNATLADKASEALTEDGLATKVVKAYIDERPVYRIQVGPYQEKDELNEAQTKLAARGIHGVLRKAEEKIA